MSREESELVLVLRQEIAFWQSMIDRSQLQEHDPALERMRWARDFARERLASLQNSVDRGVH